MTGRPRRWLALALTPMAASAALLAPARPADAAPAAGTPVGRVATALAGAVRHTPTRVLAAPGDSKTADDGADNPILSKVLETTARRYLQAERALKKSTDRQLALTLEVKQAEQRRDALVPQAGRLASMSYRTGSLSSLSFLLNSRDSRSLVQRAMALNEINVLNDRKFATLNRAIDDVSKAKAALDQEIKNEQRQKAIKLKQKVEAEKALALVGGRSLTRGFVVAKSPVAKRAPRDKNGDFTPESCKVNDPTTSGCITPRTLHMYKEVKRAGFNRFVGCHRNGGPFEHPKGRACDWSLQKRGFSVAHNADMRRYGNNLMAFLVRNADRLGVMYVIWFKQVWFPATGWSSYSGPSAHTDHVHVSML